MLLSRRNTAGTARDAATTALPPAWSATAATPPSRPLARVAVLDTKAVHLFSSKKDVLAGQADKLHAGAKTDETKNQFGCLWREHVPRCAVLSRVDV